MSQSCLVSGQQGQRKGELGSPALSLGTAPTGEEKGETQSEGSPEEENPESQQSPVLPLPLWSPRTLAGAGVVTIPGCYPTQPVCPGAGAGWAHRGQAGPPSAKAGMSSPSPESSVPGLLTGPFFATLLPLNAGVSPLSAPAAPLSSLCTSHPSFRASV